MRLARLHVRRLPGIDDPFVLEPGPGVNLVVGPNASGKSSVARAVRDLLWPSRHAGGVRWLEARFSDGDGDLVAVCDGAAPVWSRSGQPAPQPLLPPPHLADCYRLTAVDLLGGAGDLDDVVAAALRREMTGGFDLEGLAARLETPSSARARASVRELEEARRAAVALEREHAALAVRGEGLADLRARIAAAADADRRHAALVARREFLAAGRDRDAARADLDAFPAVMSDVRPEDATTFGELRDSAAARERRAADRSLECDRLDREVADLRLPADGNPETLVTRAEHLAAACRAAAHACERAGDRRATAELLLQATDDAGDPHSQPGDGILAGMLRAVAGLDSGLEALAGETRSAQPEAASRGLARPALLLAVAVLIVGVLAAPALISGPWRFLAAAVAVTLGVLGALDLARRTAGRALAAQRDRLEDLAARAAQARDRIAERSESLAAARAEADAADRRLAGVLADMAETVAPFGIAAPTTAAAAEAAAADLRRRLERRHDLGQRLEAARRDAAEAAGEARDFRRQLTGLLERLALPTDTAEAAPVRALVDRIEPWRETHDAWRAASARCRDREQEWSARAEAAGPDSAAAAPSDLEVAIAAAAAAAAVAPDLQRERGAIEREIELREQAHGLAEALAREEASRARLADWRDRARDQLFAAALLDDVLRNHEDLSAPPRLREANRLLGEFTRDRYALTLGRLADGAGFGAEDRTTGRHLRLSALSDGTRAQVLLAVRVAFITGAETGAQPPFFLDESLTTSDPGRLAAIATSLGRLAAAAGRQIFYLTSQPADVSAWRQALAGAGLPEPSLLDLAAARGMATAAAPGQITPVPLPAVPLPAGREAAAYGVLLGVRRFDPREAWQSTDTFHLAAPDLELVRRLREAGQRAAGTLSAVLPRLEKRGVIAAEERARLGRAVATVRGLTEVWRVGRPRPASAEDIDASGAVSDIMRPQVLEVLARHDWDAARFLAAARDRAVRGFRADKIDALAEHLATIGCLDDRPPLDDDGILAEVVLRVGSTLDTEARTPVNEVRALVHQLLRAIPQEIAAAPSSRTSGSGPTG